MSPPQQRLETDIFLTVLLEDSPGQTKHLSNAIELAQLFRSQSLLTKQQANTLPNRTTQQVTPQHRERMQVSWSQVQQVLSCAHGHSQNVVAVATAAVVPMRPLVPPPPFSYPTLPYYLVFRTNGNSKLPK